MSDTQINNDSSVDFIRLLFTDPVEEAIAYRWATRFARVVGGQAPRLRPETTLDEMLGWAAGTNADSMDFVLVFEPELRMELRDFLECAEQVTFREMVQHYADRFRS